jgi:hypothetical protein
MGKTSTGRPMCASIEMYVVDVDATYKPILHAAGAAPASLADEPSGVESGRRTRLEMPGGLRHTKLNSTAHVARSPTMGATCFGPQGQRRLKSDGKEASNQPFRSPQVVFRLPGIGSFGSNPL